MRGRAYEARHRVHEVTLPAGSSDSFGGKRVSWVGEQFTPPNEPRISRATRTGDRNSTEGMMPRGSRRLHALVRPPVAHALTPSVRVPHAIEFFSKGFECRLVAVLNQNFVVAGERGTGEVVRAGPDNLLMSLRVAVATVQSVNQEELGVNV